MPMIINARRRNYCNEKAQVEARAKNVAEALIKAKVKALLKA